MPVTYALVIALMTALHPSAPRTGNADAFAHAIAWTVTHDEAPATWGQELGAAFLVVYGFEEGRYQAGARRGDGGLAACSYQVHAGSEPRRRELEASPLACVRAAYMVMRANMRVCGDLSGYCGWCRGYGRDPRAWAASSAIARRRAERAQGILDAAMMAMHPP